MADPFESARLASSRLFDAMAAAEKSDRPVIDESCDEVYLALYRFAQIIEKHAEALSGDPRREASDTPVGAIHNLRHVFNDIPETECFVNDEIRSETEQIVGRLLDALREQNARGMRSSADDLMAHLDRHASPPDQGALVCYQQDDFQQIARQLSVDIAASDDDPISAVLDGDRGCVLFPSG